VKSPNSGEDHDPAGRADEFAVIDRLRARFEAAARTAFPEGALPPVGDTWIGDDAAVVALEHTNQGVWATDLVVEGVHVDLDLCGLDDVGFKAMMVAASDLAAMGAWPHYALVSIAAPEGTDIDRLGAGLAAAATAAECAVVGGDLSGSPVLVVSVSILGALRAWPGPGALLRSGAQPGDHLFVTGPLGGSAAGLRLLRGGPGSDAAGAVLLAAYRRPVARLREGEVARLAGASAAIDISDGLSADVRHLGRSSAVGIALDRIPRADGATEAEALGGGEEYELLVATPDPQRLLAAYRSAGLREPTAIGSCTRTRGRYSLNGAPLPAGGWRHRF
jgi:thiamine-monophosphate kinase